MVAIFATAPTPLGAELKFKRMLVRTQYGCKHRKPAWMLGFGYSLPSCGVIICGADARRAADWECRATL